MLARIVDPQSFGGIGIFAIKEMARFYRYVLISKRYPHHAGVALIHIGKVLFAAMKMMGVEDVMYKDENPFK